MEITNPPDNSTVLSNQAMPPTSFGAMLLRAREKKQVTLEDASAELFILKRHLQALEQERFESLPQFTFARGFAINYAKYLGLDPQQVAASFDAAYPNELRSKAVGDIESPLRPMGTLQREGRSKIKFNPLLLLAIVFVIGLAVFLLRMISNAGKEPTEPVKAIETITPTEQAEGAAINNTGVAIDQNATQGSGSALPATGNTATSAAGVAIPGLNTSGDSATTSASQLPASGQVAALDFWVVGDTAIEVTDASGKVLMSGNQSRGGYKLSGQPPYRIQIDKVNNVKLNLNQQEIALDKYATGDKASFTLAP
ncbi:MAG: DUF4115 domain-containing protein [Psychrobacter sp.]|nr:DUF4115 domain-containing protein [Psychrobacter sp.]